MSERSGKAARERIRLLIEAEKPNAMRLNDFGNLELLIGKDVHEFSLSKAERRAVRQYMDSER